MNTLNEYFKKNHDPKIFTHIPVEKKPDLQTKTIQGKRFYILPDGEKLPSITTVLSARGNEGIARWRASRRTSCKYYNEKRSEKRYCRTYTYRKLS